MTTLNYLQDTYLFTSTAKIIKQGTNDFGDFLILDQTIFYPQGGGQPSDTGRIVSGKNIFQVQHVTLDQNGIVIHYGEYINNSKFTKDSITTLYINKEKRLQNAKNHTAGHLLDIAVKNIGLNIVAKKGFHFTAGCYVEYSGIYNIEEKENILEKLNTEINDLIIKKMKIFVDNNLEGDAPEGKAFRKIYFQGYEDFGTGCGGTHLHSTGEIGKVTIKNIKNKKGNCKISYEVI